MGRYSPSVIQLSEPQAVGIDWCNGVWVAVEMSDRECRGVSVADAFVDLWEKYGEVANRMVVDVPIGLYLRGDRGEAAPPLVRECDRLARTLIGPRFRSVFNPPAREAIEAKCEEEGPYDEVKELHQEITGKGLTQQGYYISSAIYQVDQLLRDDVEGSRAREVIFEGHPEVAFSAFKGAPLSNAKRTAPGFSERLHSLEDYLDNPGRTFLAACDALDEVDGSKVDIDDLLDALALSITAGAPEREFQFLPHESPPRDSIGLPMQMVYRADDPFSVDE